MEECVHETQSVYDGITICDECGLQIEESLINNEVYSTGSKWNRNPVRCHPRKEVERSLYNDLQFRGFPQRIIERANDYYKQIIEDKIYRAKKRLAIVFACTFYAYIDFDEPQSAIELAKRFDLDKKGVSTGLKTFSTFFKNRSIQKHVSPMDLVPKILSDIGLKDYTVYYEDIEKIYNVVEANSKIVKTSIPQSVAAGLVFFYLKLKNHPITKSEYAKTVNLTEITFTKIASNIDQSLK